MISTLIYGLLVAVLILAPLIILHEFGHYFVAEWNKVKVLEFGFGFPPRAFGVWSGNTVITMLDYAEYEAEGGLDSLRVGDFTTIKCRNAPDGSLEGMFVLEYDKKHLNAVVAIADLYVGKIKEIEGNRIVLADMLWSFNWLPFGGFVKMRGEEDGKAHDSLAGKSVPVRTAVMIAGVAVNAVIPIIIFAVYALIPVQHSVGDVVVTNVFPGSPAYEAGIRPLQRIVSIDGEPVGKFSDLQAAVTKKLGTTSEWEIQRGIPNPFARPFEPDVQYLEGDTETVIVTPRWDPPRYDIVLDVDDPDTQMRLGVARVYNSSVGINDELTVTSDGTVRDDLREIALANAREYVPTAQIGDVIPITNAADGLGIPYLEARKFNSDLGSVTYLQEGAAGVQLQLINSRTESRSVPITRAIPEGFGRTYDVIVLARNSIYGALSGSRNPQFDAPLAVGPVGLSQLSGEVVTSEIPISSRIRIIATLAATLSLSLAVINLLPIPGLDGGRLAFVFLEVIRGGKRISPEKEGIVHLAGFVLMIGLIIAISFGDILRLINGERFL